MKKFNFPPNFFIPRSKEVHGFPRISRIRGIQNLKSVLIRVNPWTLFTILFFGFFLASCATSPRAAPVLPEGGPNFSILPPNAQAYFWADVASARPILDILPFIDMSSRDVTRFLDRTNTALAAFYGEDAEQRFFLASWGNYPSFRLGTFMNFSRNWRRVRSETGSRYRQYRHQNLAVAVGSSLAFVSDGDPFAPGLGSDPAPYGFEEFRRVSVFSGWLNEPAAYLNRIMQGLGIPLQIPAEELFFGINRLPLAQEQANEETAPWELVFGIGTQSPAVARSLLPLFSMASFFIQMGTATGGLSGQMEIAALLFANAPEQNGSFLTLRTAPLDENRLALLFYMFWVYSN